MTETPEYKYTMTISLNVLHHLGIGLYGNVPAVLSEVVANCWDADATDVDILIDREKDTIVIKDDGVGMNADDINKKYLHVGYEKRKNEPRVTPKYNRRLMGKKGIGKLSVFSIADTVEVYSTRDGEVNGLLMRRQDIEAAMAREDDRTGDYHPVEVDRSDVEIEEGTRIVLRDLKKNMTTTETFLRRRLARRFSIIGSEHNFKVAIDGERITAQDRGFLPKIEFLWYLGKGSSHFRDDCTNLKKDIELSDIVDEDRGYRVTGWVGTVEDQKSIDEWNNTIVVFARGKLVHEDILKDVKEGGLFTKYLVGEIDADFLDSDEEAEDAITSARQRVKEDDPRYEALREFVQKEILKKILNQWEELRRSGAKEKALENPAIDRWYGRLRGDNKKVAERLFGTIESLRGIDEEGKKELYRYGILAFEKLALKSTLSALDLIKTEADFEMVKGLVDSIDEIEAVHYHQIAKGRMDVIEQFRELIDKDPAVKERILQEHIFDHLWLLHPSWERASTNARIEEAVTKEFDAVTARLSEEERRGRIDIRYQTYAGRHVIVELKKYDNPVGIYELLGQIDKYIGALRKCLETQFPDETRSIETICILGSPPRPKEQDVRNRQLLYTLNARYVLYDQLIVESLNSYAEYLKKQEEITEIIEIIESI